MSRFGHCHWCERTTEFRNSLRIARGELLVDKARRLSNTDVPLPSDDEVRDLIAGAMKAIGVTEMTPLAAELDVARKRIAELEAAYAELDAKNAQQHKVGETCLNLAGEHLSRANRLSDEAGALRSELTQTKAELCDALREVERLKRRVKR